MYDERLKKIVVCINLDNTVRCDGFAVLQPIVVAKGKHKTSPIVVTANEWTTIKPSGPHVRHSAQDITPWLFTSLWKQELLQEFGEVDTRSSSVVPDEPTPTILTVEPVDKKVYSSADIEKLRKGGFGKLADRIEGVIPEPSTNGNGKHKTKPR